MSGALLAFRYAATSLLTPPDIGLLASSIVLGIIIYFVTLKAIRTKALNEMIGLVQEIVSPYAKLVIAKIPLCKKEVLHVADEK